MQIKIVHGNAVAPHIPDLARLRIEVFRAFPDDFMAEGRDAHEQKERDWSGLQGKAPRKA